MNGWVRGCWPKFAIALCAIAIAIGAMAPAAHAAEQSPCALRAASGLITADTDVPAPPMPSGILSDADSDELAFVRLSRSFESHVSGVLLVQDTHVGQQASTPRADAVPAPSDPGLSLVDQAIRLQV